MADNYTLFSEVLADLTDEEEAWLTEQLQTICVFGDYEYAEDNVPEHLSDTSCDWEGPRFLRDNDDFDPDCDVLGFEYAFHDDPGDWNRHLWVYAEENGNPEHVACLIQKFLKRFCPEKHWIMTWACTCSKPRAGEFCGAAILVTAKTIKWFDPGVAAAEAAKKLKSKEQR